MPRAKISYEQRVLIQDMREKGFTAKEICEAVGLSSYDYQRELRLGYIAAERKYSADKAQFALK